ncbi:MAG: type VI secretion system lipoprotein TssJ [Myxococcales bacterium]|nr:type VI secretion system lipoprotein TssJ [Myxococcales bacterium]
MGAKRREPRSPVDERGRACARPSCALAGQGTSPARHPFSAPTRRVRSRPAAHRRSVPNRRPPGETTRELRRGLLAAALLVACRPPPPAAPCDAPQRIDVVLDSDARLNLGEGDESWPTHVRIYQLDATPPIEAIEPRDLDADEAAALGRAPLSRRDHVVYPASRERWSIDVDPSATHLALFGLFHRAAPGEAGAVVPLPLAPATCPAADAPPRCVYVVAAGSQLRGALRPPPGFVGDGLPCATTTSAEASVDARPATPPTR